MSSPSGAGTHPSVLEQSSLCSRPSLGPRAEAGEGPLPASPKGEKVQEKQATIPYFSISPAGEQDFFLEEPNRARAGDPQLGVSVEGGRNVSTSSTTQQANNKVSKLDLGPAECRRSQSLQGQCWAPGAVPGETPQGSPGNSRGKEQPLHHSAPTHGQVLGSILLGQQPGHPRALQTTPVTFLKDIWCHQVVWTQVSLTASP